MVIIRSLEVSEEQITLDNIQTISCNGIIIHVKADDKRNIHKFRDLHIRLAKTTNHIKFLRRCKKNHLVPKGFRLKIPNLPKRKFLETKFGNTLVQEQLDVLYRKRSDDLREEQIYRNNLQIQLNSRTWTIVWIWTLVSEKEVFLETRRRHIQKYSKLEEEMQKGYRRKHYVRTKVYNLSTRVLTDTEQALLSKGLNFVPTHSRGVTPTDISNVEKTAKRLGNQGQVLIHLTKSYFNGKAHGELDNLSKIEREALNTLKAEDSIIVTNADKGKAVVVLNRDDYNSKLREVLASGSYRKLPSDPTKSRESKLREKLKELEEGNFLESKTVTKILSNNMNVATIYGCPKVHKNGVPLRPVVSTIGTPLSELSKFLLDIINPLSTVGNTHALKNTEDFVTQLREKTVSENCIMLSLDVVNMYGSIPVDKCLQIVRNLLDEDMTLLLRTTLPISTILELLSTCITSAYFKHENDYYEQVKGLSMGSSLAPCLASIFMNNVEQRMQDLPYYQFLNWLRRFVDDYFVLWTGSREALDSFHESCNELEPSIKFTKELENEGELPYLDVKVIKLDDRFKTVMYEKECSSGLILNYHSNHAASTKSNIIKNLHNKVERCSDDKERDLLALKKKFKDNEYPEHAIKRVIDNPVQRQSVPDKCRKVPLTIPFLGPKSYAFKRKVSKLGVKVYFTREKNISDIIGKKGKTKGGRETNVVYQITCECGEIYIGETGRELQIRVNEHNRYVRNNNPQSGIARHVSATGHKIDFKNVKILHKEQNEYKRRISESYFINKLKPKLNLVEGLTISDIWTE